MTDDGYGETGASGAKQQARETIAEAKQRTTEQVETRLAEQKGRAARTLNGVSQSLMMSSRHLREQQQPGASRYVERAAEEVDRLAQYLDARDVSDIVDQVENLARRKPAAFLGGAVVLGFVAGRFLKSSSRPRHTSGFEVGRRETYRNYEPSIRRDSRGYADVEAKRTDNRW
jgi:gas vesicle protein